MTDSLRALLERGAENAPGKVVVSAGPIDVTWSALRERACRVAGSLVRDGVKPQDRVIYIGKNDVRYFDILFGCALAGAVMTPVNWRLAPDEIDAIVEDSRATIAFVDGDVVPRVTPKLSVVVGLGRDDEWVPFSEWCGPAADPGVPPRPDHIAFQLYTSGTTGRPKGAMFANGRNLRVLLDDISVQWGFGPEDVSLVILPLFHMGGLAWALAGLARGARCVVMRDFDPVAVLETAERSGVTVAFFVPAMLAAVVAAGSRPLRLKRVFYSGAPISPTALTAAMAALRCDFIQIYGLTEATGAFAQLPSHEHDPNGPLAHLLLSAGRPYSWVEVCAMSADTGRPVPAGEVGEIWTRSEQNMVGYWNDTEQSARALTPDGWLRTGDLGRLDDEGRIFLVDREKDLIISGGENVYPVEVENILATHPGLAEFAVIGVPHDRWGETVKAIVVPRTGVAVDGQQVIDFVRQHLARFKCPTSIDIVEALPRTATGKVLKYRLREP